MLHQLAIQLSYSASQKYKTSPRAYYLHYILRLRPTDLSSALFFGSAIDNALNFLLQGKKDGSDQTAVLAIAKSAFEASWNHAKVDDKEIDLSRIGVIKYSKSDYDEGILTSDDRLEIETSNKDPHWVSLKRKGLMFLEAYDEQILKHIKEVKFVQKDIKLENDMGDSFIGFIDFCAVWEDGRTIIFDNKTSSIKYSADSASTSEQLATYHEATKEEIKVDAVGYIVIPKKIRKYKEPRVPIEVIIDNIDEKVVNETFEMYDEVLSGIKLGDFPCTRHDEDGCCSVPWGCPYRKYCESNGKDLTGLVFHEKKK